MLFVLFAGCAPSTPQNVPSGRSALIIDTDTTLPSDTGDTSLYDTDAPDTDPPDDTGAPLLPRTHWCRLLTHSLGDPMLLDVDIANHSTTQVGGFTGPAAGRTSGLARLGNTYVASVYTGNGYQWYELDVDAGTTRIEGDAGYTVAVGSDGQQLYSLCPGSLLSEICAFDDFDSLVAGVPSQVVYDGPLQASRYQPHEDRIYAAWHSTSVIDVLDPATNIVERSIQLADFDTWVQGISVVDDRLYVVDDGRGDFPTPSGSVRLAVFDLVTGANLDNIFLDGPFAKPAGLWCEAY